MTKRRTMVVVLGACALAVPLALAQSKDKIWRVGYLDYGSRQFAEESRRYATFIEGMRALGRVEGKDFVVEARYADGKSERLAALAAELVAARVDVVLSAGTPTTH